MKLSKESYALSNSLNSYMKEHANEPMGHEKKEAKAKALKKASVKGIKTKGDYKNEAERGADYKKHNILHHYKINGNYK